MCLNRAGICWSTLGMFLVVFVLPVCGDDTKTEDKKADAKVEKKSEEYIAQQKKSGVTVQVNQIQIQRIGTKVSLLPSLKKFGFDPEKYSRTIAISISQNGQGKSSGPISIELKNGEKLNPFSNANQTFMSVVANAEVPKDFDFMETWFGVPKETKFEDIFPITVHYAGTDSLQKPVQFRFKNIHP